MLDDKVYQVDFEDEEYADYHDEPSGGDGSSPNCKNALSAFIAAIIALVLSSFGIGFIPGIISLSFLKKIHGEPERQPFRAFAKIAKPVSIVSIILSVVMLLFWIIYIIVFVIVGVGAAAGAYDYYIALLF